MPLGLGIDFEHIYHTPAYRSLEGEPEIPIDIEGLTERILQLLARYDSRATFFVVSELAGQHSQLLRRVASAGHEIASHSVSHPSLPSLATSEIQREVRESKELLERVTDTSVKGFRAPTCQLDDRVYSALVDAGYVYSSSVMPTVPVPGFYSDEYGFGKLTRIVTEGGQLIEQPLSVSPLLPFPISGAWIRLLGRRYTLRSIGWRLQHCESVVTYVHPWEFTNLQKTPLPFRNRFRTGDWVWDTYESILSMEEESIPVGELVKQTTIQEEYSLTAE